MPFMPKPWQNGPAGGTPIDAAALIDLETRVAAASGSSIVDLGTVSIVYLLNNGPQTLYTPAGPELVEPFDLQSSRVFTDRFTITAKRGSTVPIYGLDTTSSTTQFYDQGFSSSPLLVGISLVGSAPLLSPVTWTAQHAYVTQEIIQGPDSHLWGAGGDGISGTTIPDFASYHGTATDFDGTIPGWQDVGPFPTVGSVHLYARVTKLPT